MIYFCKKRKLISMRVFKIKFPMPQCLIKYKLRIDQCKKYINIGRQFYESSKHIMTNYDSGFHSESDREEIDNLVYKNFKKHKKEQNFQSEKLEQKEHYQSIQDQKEIQQIQFRQQKHLASNIRNKKQLSFKIVKIYYDFFVEQKSLIKAEQIMHIYKKKLCQEGMIIPTLFCWLNDWIQNQFLSFLKNQLNQLSNLNQKKAKKSNHLSIQQLKSHHFSIQQQKFHYKMSSQLKNTISSEKIKNRQTQNKSLIQLNQYLNQNLTSQKSKQDLFQKISLIKKKNYEFKSRQLSNGEYKNFENQIQGPKQIVFMTIQGGRQRSETFIKRQTIKQGRNFTINHYQLSNLLPNKLESNQTNTDQFKKQAQLDQNDLFPINRQILIGSYYERFLSLYKNLQSVLPDLDIQYIKKIKRNDRKTQIKKRINQVCRVLIKNQPLTKSSIEQFDIAYHQRIKKLKRFKKLQNNKQKVYKDTDNFYKGRLRQKKFHSLSLTQDNQQFKFKISSQKKINSNLLAKKQIIGPELGSFQSIYQIRKGQKTKQLLLVNHPIRFQLNLPKIPQKHQNRIKQNSKVVLIQSGRYKLLDSLGQQNNTQLMNKKVTKNSRSTDLQRILESDKNQNMSNISIKRSEIFSSHSPTVLEMMAKKGNKKILLENKKTENKKLISKILHKSLNAEENNQEEGPAKILGRDAKTKLKKKIFKYTNSGVQSNVSELIKKIDYNEYIQISGWQGQQSPAIIN